MTDIFAVALFPLTVAAWIVAGILWRGHRREPHLHALSERAQLAVRDAIVATMLAFLGLNRLVSLGLPNDAAITLLIGSLLLIVAYPIRWLFLYTHDRIR